MWRDYKLIVLLFQIFLFSNIFNQNRKNATTKFIDCQMNVTNIKKINSRKVQGYAIRMEGVHFIFRLDNIYVCKVKIVGAIF
jgi:hypothetical protein